MSKGHAMTARGACDTPIVSVVEAIAAIALDPVALGRLCATVSFGL